MADDLAKIGSLRRAWLGIGFTRMARILAVDEQDGTVFVEWPEYNIQNEWIRLGQIT
jgi:hypothetical protein